MFSGSVVFFGLCALVAFACLLCLKAILPGGPSSGKINLEPKPELVQKTESAGGVGGIVAALSCLFGLLQVLIMMGGGK